jgi:hypothetical protein
MKKNFVWGALAIATATAIGGSYQIFAQASTTSPRERQGSKDSQPLLRPGETRVTEQNLAVQPGLPMQPGVSSPYHPNVRDIYANHFETVIIEDGKVKVISSNEPLDEETRAKSNEARKQLDDAFRTFRSEDSSDQDRAKARTTLSSYLTAQFDHDQEMRRKQIKSLEEEVDKLKKQIAKREESKDKLVDLRLTLLENDANGLAFPPAFNQIPGANGPGFGPAGAVYGIPGAAYPGAAYSVQTYNMPAPGVLPPPSFGLGQTGPYSAVPVEGVPSDPNKPGYPVPPNPPASGSNNKNRSR